MSRARGSVLLWFLQQVLRKTRDQGPSSLVAVDSSRVYVCGLKIERKLDCCEGPFAVGSARAFAHEKLFNSIQIVKPALFQSRDRGFRDLLQQAGRGSGSSPKPEGK
jgi:hypothetical protein